MAMLTETRGAAATAPGLVSRLIGKLVERYTQYAAYRKCVDELASLSDRELRDLDIHRSMIRSIAYETAYRTY